MWPMKYPYNPKGFCASRTVAGTQNLQSILLKPNNSNNNNNINLQQQWLHANPPSFCPTIKLQILLSLRAESHQAKELFYIGLDWSIKKQRDWYCAHAVNEIILNRWNVLALKSDPAIGIRMKMAKEIGKKKMKTEKTFCLWPLFLRWRQWSGNWSELNCLWKGIVLAG